MQAQTLLQAQGAALPVAVGVVHGARETCPSAHGGVQAADLWAARLCLGLSPQPRLMQPLRQELSPQPRLLQLSHQGLSPQPRLLQPLRQELSPQPRLLQLSPQRLSPLPRLLQL